MNSEGIATLIRFNLAEKTHCSQFTRTTKDTVECRQITNLTQIPCKHTRAPKSIVFPAHSPHIPRLIILNLNLISP